MIQRWVSVESKNSAKPLQNTAVCHSGSESSPNRVQVDSVNQCKSNGKQHLCHSSPSRVRVESESTLSRVRVESATSPSRVKAKSSPSRGRVKPGSSPSRARVEFDLSPRRVRPASTIQNIILFLKVLCWGLFFVLGSRTEISVLEPKNCSLIVDTRRTRISLTFDELLLFRIRGQFFGQEQFLAQEQFLGQEQMWLFLTPRTRKAEKNRRKVLGPRTDPRTITSPRSEGQEEYCSCPRTTVWSPRLGTVFLASVGS